MKNDQKIQKKVKEIHKECEDFCNYIANYKNQCAYSDDMIRNIIKKSSELKTLYDENCWE